MQLCGRHGLITVLFLLCAFPISESSSAVIRSISINGVSAVSQREVLSWLSSQPNAAFSDTLARRDLQRITENYRSRGYLDADASLLPVRQAADTSSVDLVITVREGRLTLIGAIKVLSRSITFPPDVLSLLSSRPGQPLEEGVIEQDIHALLAYCEKRGYPFALCRVDSLGIHPGPEADSLDVALRVSEGEKMTIDEIRVEGLRETRPDVVVREARIVQGEAYDPARVAAIRSQLVRLNIFSSVSEPELFMHQGKGGVLLKVQEGSPNTFDGVVGYMPGVPGGASGYLTGLVSVSMRNLFGTGRKFSVRWQKEDRNSQELALRYLEPWVLGAPVNIGGGFFQRQQDTAFVHRTLDVRGELMISTSLMVALVFRSDHVIPSADSLTNRTLRSATSSLGAEVLYDTRDDIYSPTTGARYRADYSYGRRTVPPTATNPGFDSPLQRFTVDLDFFVPTFTRQVVAAGMHVREVRGGRLGESELYRFGGTNSLRGYRENQFIASRVAWVTGEYRLLLARHSFVAAFSDVGYYAAPGDDIRGTPGTEALKYGYGIGVRVDTPLGNLGVSYALGQGDSFSTGKIHVGLINEF